MHKAGLHTVFVLFGSLFIVSSKDVDVGTLMRIDEFNTSLVRTMFASGSSLVSALGYVSPS